MGIFDKVKQMKADHDAKKAAEAAELLALCNRLRQNEIFLNYADRLYATLSDQNDANVQWATGRSSDQNYRRLAIVVTPNDFGLVAFYGYDEPYRDSDGKVRTQTIWTFDPIDIQKFADYGMQALPDKVDVRTAVLETLASRLKEVSYLSMTHQPIRTYDGERYSSYDAIQINVSNSGVQQKRNAW